MVGRITLSHIDLRLQEILGLPKCGEKFGGISILGVGDMYQLPPVRQKRYST